VNKTTSTSFIPFSSKNQQDDPRDEAAAAGKYIHIQTSNTMRHRSYTIIPIHRSPGIHLDISAVSYFPNNARYRRNAIHAIQLTKLSVSIPVLPQPALAFSLSLGRIGRGRHCQCFFMVTASTHTSTSSACICDSITIVIPARCALHLMWSPCDWWSHFECLISLADIPFAEIPCCDPYADNAKEDDDDHDDPSCMRCEPVGRPLALDSCVRDNK
jgi:hypothetical protein